MRSCTQHKSHVPKWLDDISPLTSRPPASVPIGGTVTPPAAVRHSPPGTGSSWGQTTTSSVGPSVSQTSTQLAELQKGNEQRFTDIYSKMEEMSQAIVANQEATTALQVGQTTANAALIRIEEMMQAAKFKS